MSCIAVIDFETTGLSPAMGDRATDVAIVLVENGCVVDRFQSLMNAGLHIPAFITASPASAMQWWPLCPMSPSSCLMPSLRSGRVMKQ